MFFREYLNIYFTSTAEYLIFFLISCKF